MKRIRPVTRYDAEAGYPSVADCALSRRGFLAGAAATLGATLLPDVDALARGRGRWLRVEIRVNVRLGGRGYRFVEKLIVQTRSKRLQTFLRQAAEQKGVRRAVLAVLSKASGADTADRKKLARLEGRLAQALVNVYRARRRRSVATPLVTLVLVTHRRMPAYGWTTPPRAPAPHP